MYLSAIATEEIIQIDRSNYKNLPNKVFNYKKTRDNNTRRLLIGISSVSFLWKKYRANADNFIFRSLEDIGDIITDFNSAEGDKIEIYRSGFAGSATTSDRFSFDDNALFFDDQQIATLENVSSFNVDTDIVLVL